MDRFGNYIIERELGRGGMGVVYAARHAILGHHVALKMLHGELSAREDVVQRFFNEARAAAAIAHPGIVRVHDVGVGDRDGVAFLVMDLLAGESLAQRLKARGPMPVVEAIDVARQIADALASAHAVGIVHRDLKPDNIFLVAEPAGQRVVLLDFGVAKLTGALQSGSDLKTKTGALLGTPSYMSPEQCDGERDVDHRSDLYSLGCMLFVMIGGRLPFEGGIGAVIGAHLHVPAPFLRTVAPDAPAAIEAIVTRLMAKDPAARFASATELVRALDAWTPSASQRMATPLPARRFDMGVAETLPIPRTSEPTLDSIAPPPSEQAPASARPPITAPDEDVAPDTVREDKRPEHVPSPPRVGARRGVLVLAAAVGLAGLGLLVLALARTAGSGLIDAAVALTGDAAAAIDATVALTGDAANPIDASLIAADPIDASLIAADPIDASLIAASPPDAASRGDAMPRDATAVVAITRDATAVAAITRDARPFDATAVANTIDANTRGSTTPDATTVAAAPLDAPRIDLVPKPKGPPTIDERILRVANAETDFEASRDYMLLELHAPGDPRLPRAREDARKAIRALARDEQRKAIHLALVDHDWKGGLDKCRAWGGDLRVDIVVQCTVFACVLDDAHLEQWARGVGYRPMLEEIAAFCERFRKP